MVDKKSQVVVFILLVLVVFFLVAFVLYVSADKNSDDSAEIRNGFDVKSISNFVNFCLREKNEEALVEVASKGGYFSLPVYSTERLPDNLPYFLYQGSIFIPPIEKVQENVALAVENQLGDCLNFTGFEGLNISVETPPAISVLLHADAMQVTLHQKIVVRNEQSETTVESFTASIPTVFLRMYEHTKKIVETHTQSGEYVCLSCLRQLNALADFTTKTGMTPEAFLYTLEEDKQENSKSITFKFAVKP